jgi:YfiH family protein
MRAAEPASRGLHPDWLVAGDALPGAFGLQTTRAGGVSAGPFASLNLRDGLGDEPAAVAENFARLRAATGVEPVLLNQVHGTRVVRVGRADVGVVHEADASITTEIGVACAVGIADCLPVLMSVPGGVAAAHAGWRGLAGGVVEHTLAALCDATGAAPADVHVWLGACIGSQAFEVGADVLDGFGVDATQPSPRFRPCKPGMKPDKWLADLPGLARDRLAAAGVRHVAGGTWCTVADASRFFSFRRDRLTGRMLALCWRG